MRFEERTEDFQQFLNKVKQQDKNAEDLKALADKQISEINEIRNKNDKEIKK